MGNIKKMSARHRSVQVVPNSEKNSYISSEDIEMDKRASEAVQAAVRKAVVCKTPIAKYDKASGQSYLEYSDGQKKLF